MKHSAYHWPDHVIGKRESRRIRDEHNAIYNDYHALLAAFNAALERMEYVAEHIPVENRHEGVSQRAHVSHMAGHLSEHAKIARAAIAKAVRDNDGVMKQCPRTTLDEWKQRH